MNGAIFDRANETLRPEQLEQVQLERLQALLARLRRNVRRARDLLGEARVEALADLARLPFTTPASLVEAFPYGLFALPLREVVRLHSTVGPEGRQLVVGHTHNDLTVWSRLAARQLVAAGVTSTDVIQVCFGGGFFGQALGYMGGAQLVGACVIPEAPYHVEYQLELIRNYRATVLVTTPTNARDLMELLRARRLDPQTLQLRTILLSRPVTDSLRHELEAGLFGRVFCTFGLAEILDPGFCVQCPEHNLHVNEDQFIAELDAGELVVTTLTREAMPLLRYRTRLAARLERRRCACGRTGAVLEPGARLDGQTLVHEMPLYRSQVAELMAASRLAGLPFRLEAGERQVALAVEMSPAVFSDEMRLMAEIKESVQAAFLARFGIAAEIRFVAPGACAEAAASA
jgi:phenylacetate-CoA ligase